LKAVDFAHACEGASHMRDSDGTADNQRDVERVNDFVALPALFATADQVIRNAIIAS
jgi:hypothetical protein